MEGRGGVGQGQRGLVGAGEGTKGRGSVGIESSYLPPRTVLCTVEMLRPTPPTRCFGGNNEKGVNAETVEILNIIVIHFTQYMCTQLCQGI